MKYAETLEEIRKLHAIDGHCLDAARRAVRTRGAHTQGVGLCLALGAPVVGWLESFDPFGFTQHRPELAGGLHPIDPPRLACPTPVLGCGSPGGEVPANAGAK